MANEASNRSSFWRFSHDVRGLYSRLSATDNTQFLSDDLEKIDELSSYYFQSLKQSFPIERNGIAKRSMQDFNELIAYKSLIADRAYEDKAKAKDLWEHFVSNFSTIKAISSESRDHGKIIEVVRKALAEVILKDDTIELPDPVVSDLVKNKIVVLDQKKQQLAQWNKKKVASIAVMAQLIIQKISGLSFSIGPITMLFLGYILSYVLAPSISKSYHGINTMINRGVRKDLVSNGSKLPNISNLLLPQNEEEKNEELSSELRDSQENQLRSYRRNVSFFSCISFFDCVMGKRGFPSDYWLQQNLSVSMNRAQVVVGNKFSHQPIDILLELSPGKDVYKGNIEVDLEVLDGIQANKTKHLLDLLEEFFKLNQKKDQYYIYNDTEKSLGIMFVPAINQYLLLDFYGYDFSSAPQSQMDEDAFAKLHFYPTLYSMLDDIYRFELFDDLTGSLRPIKQKK